MTADVISNPTPLPAKKTPALDPRLAWLTPRRCRVMLGLVLLAGFGGHLLYLMQDCPIDLAGDEAHYWDWSRQLDWSYYSKGPLVAYLIRASCWAFGEDSMLAVRMPALVLGVATLVVVYLMALRVYGSERVALGAVLLFHLVPMLAAGSMLMTIDPPFFFCWALATYLVSGRGALGGGQEEGRRGLWVWVCIGVVVGVGFLAKYAMLLWFVPLLLMLACTRSLRPTLRTAGPWVAMAVALLFTTPVIAWNARHGWVSLWHVSTQTGTNAAGGFDIMNVLEFFGGQLAVVGPVLWVLMGAAVWSGLRISDGRLERLAAEAQSAQRRSDATPDSLRLPRLCGESLLFNPQPEIRNPQSSRLLLFFSLTYLALCLLTSFRTKIQPNWPAPAYFTLLILTAGFIASRLRDRRLWKPWRPWFWTSVGLGVVALPLLHYMDVTYPAMRWAAAWSGRDDLTPRRLDVAARLKGWKDAGAHLSDELTAMGPEAFMLCEDYQQTAEMAFYLRGQPKTYYAGSHLPSDAKRMAQYDIWPDRRLAAPNPLIGRDAIFLAKSARLPPDLRHAFESIEGIDANGKTKAFTYVHERGGMTVRTFYYFRCRGFRGMRPAWERY